MRKNTRRNTVSRARIAERRARNQARPRNVARLQAKRERQVARQERVAVDQAEYLVRLLRLCHDDGRALNPLIRDSTGPARKIFINARD
jgi:hypothetical protein